MKKSSLQSLVAYLDGQTVDNISEIRDEIVAELAKGAEKAQANRETYAEYHDKVMAVLAGVTDPVTAQDISDETGIARGKIVYGLRNYWANEVVIDSTGKVNTYRLA